MLLLAVLLCNYSNDVFDIDSVRHITVLLVRAGIVLSASP
jgi:hypothetical protein